MYIVYENMEENIVIKNFHSIDNMETVRIQMDEIDTHFTQKLEDDLYKIREQLYDTYENAVALPLQNTYRGSDSPLTMSSNSDEDSNNYSIQKINLNEISVLDVLIAYFRCQKYIYEQANVITQCKHNAICGVTITISSSICIFIAFLEPYQWRTILIIILNAIISILLAISKHLKLEQNAGLYLYLSWQYELMSDSIKQKPSSMPKLRELENRMIEMRDIPNIIIPQSIQVLYPVASNINIFSFIKKVNARNLYVTEELNKTKCEIGYILKKYKDNMGSREKNRLHYLIDLKENLKKELKLVQTAYLYMEEIFTREINKADYYRQNYMQIFFTSNTDFAVNHDRCNTFVDEYISFILPKK
jgi:hypothetical protein